jgi:hypothetical protein
MIRFLFCLFFSFGILICSKAAVVPSQSPAPGVITQKVFLKNMENALGRKLTFREKLALKVSMVRSRFFMKNAGEPTPQQLKQGKIAAILGGSALLIFLIAGAATSLGAVILLTLPLGIAALILGIKSSRGNGNTLGLIGLITGAVVTFFWLLAAIVIAVFLSTWSW